MKNINNLKVLIVSNSLGLITSFLKNDVEILCEMGYEIVCACNTDYEGSNSHLFIDMYNIKLIHVDFPIRDLEINRILSSYKQLKKIINSEDFDLVHCHSTIASIITRECTKKLRDNGLKVIYTSHGFPFYKGASKIKNILYKNIEKKYSKMTDAIITICEEDYQNALKLKCKKVYKINGVGIDLDKFISIEENERINIRKEFGISESDKVILSIGEINTNKNHKVIIKAIAKINIDSLIYIICGRELVEIGKMSELQELANKLKVRVVFLGYRNDIPKICNIADIGAIPSFKEGLGLAGIEMMASGLPIVGSNRQGIKDYVINDETGYLCDPESDDDFANGIQKVLKMDSTNKQKCKEKAKEFNLLNSRKKLIDIYNDVLN